MHEIFMLQSRSSCMSMQQLLLWLLLEQIVNYHVAVGLSHPWAFSQSMPTGMALFSSLHG